MIRTTFAFIGRNLWLMMRSRWHRFGYASVNFGAPVSVRAWCRQHQIDPAVLEPAARIVAVEKLARELMAQVRRQVPVLPIPLVAECLLSAPDGINEFDLKDRVYRRIDALRAQGATVVVPSSTRAWTIDNALNMLMLRRLVSEEGGIYRLAPDSHALLAYYAHSLSP